MNPATTTVTSEAITNMMVLVEPFVLFLGRKKYSIKEPARVEFLQQYETYHNEDDFFGPTPPSRVVSETASLFIGNKLYATENGTQYKP